MKPIEEHIAQGLRDIIYKKLKNKKRYKLVRRTDKVVDGKIYHLGLEEIDIYNPIIDLMFAWSDVRIHNWYGDPGPTSWNFVEYGRPDFEETVLAIVAEMLKYNAPEERMRRAKEMLINLGKSL